MIFAEKNGREIPEGDRIFAIGNRAKKRIKTDGPAKVVNATIGALLDDGGELIVMSSVIDAIEQLEPKDYAEYAPITGISRYKEAVKRELFGTHMSDRDVKVCATPGGAGAIRNAVSNYSKMGDSILTTDWHWAPYRTIASEIGRKLETFEMFDEEGAFNIPKFTEKVNEMADKQDSLLIILNTPAHNPTGYSLTEEDWHGVIAALNEASENCRISLLVDVAYIDFAGDEDKSRVLFDHLENLNAGVLPLIAYSASKTFTLYGLRCGALVCMAPNGEIAAEFKRVNEFSSRASWSNSTRAAQVVLSNISESPELRKKVEVQRAVYRDMLLKRGKTFSKALHEAGVPIAPFTAGFFCCVECEDPDHLSAELEKEGIYVVPLQKGVRVSVASISEEKCIRTAEAIARILK
jgi:aromatic-amino-acid transaminase